MASKIITSNGHEVLVDDDDFKELNKYCWWACIRGLKIDIFRSSRKGGAAKNISISREIIKPPKGFVVDHINGNRFDNRKENLRICTRSQNAQNRGPKNGKKYKGVFKQVSGNSVGYSVEIKCDGRRYYVGRYKDEKSAALAYDRAAIKIHGKFARLNFPELKADEIRGNK